MGAISFANSSVDNYNRYNSFLAGNAATPIGGLSSYDLLETTVLTSSASSVSFTGLGAYSDYKHLQIRGVAQIDYTSAPGAFDLSFTLNSSGSTYANHRLNGDGSTVSSIAQTSQSKIFLRDTTTSATNSSNYGAFVIDILDFSSTSKNTTVRALTGALDIETDINLTSGAWFDTSAVTSIAFSDGFDYTAGSRFSLYGIKAA